MTQSPPLETQRLQVRGMDCSGCVLKIESNLQSMAGVTEAAVNLANSRLVVSFNPSQVSLTAIQDRVRALGYQIEVEAAGSGKLQSAGHDHSHPQTCGSDHPAENSRHTHSPDRAAFNLRRSLIPVLIVVVLFIIGITFEQSLHHTPYHIAEYAIFIPAYLLSGWSVLKAAGRNILRGQVFDENFLMTIATLGAIAIHKLPEAVAVMLFFKIGELFQESAVHRSRRSIAALLEIRPDSARLLTDQGIQVVRPETVQVGDRILVKPGEKIALDGVLIEGNSQVDTSALTGESIPRVVRAGDSVLAGMINQQGLLTLEVTKPFAESSIARILDLVENASSKKAVTEKLITRFARRYTPIVVLLSLALALLPPLLIPGATSAEWIYRALILLVISCPCGLVISIPLGYFGGIGGAARRGILVKGSAFLDTLAQVKAIVFDKTGTLTQGVFRVAELIPYNGFSQSDLLRFAAEAEFHSNHPIAKSIQTAYGQPIQAAAITDYQEIPGHGVQATVEHQQILVGNDRLLHRLHVDHEICDFTGTVVHVAVNQHYAGCIVIDDEPKPDAAEAIQTLRQLGVEQIAMLTGDSAEVAERIARRLHLDQFQAELLPEDKVTAVETILHQVGQRGKVAFVGDGINDAPVIARADVGIAMGALGSDAAIETADVVLMTDAPSKVAQAIQIARKTHTIVWQNIIFAMVIKLLFIGLGVLGYATMWEAVFADVGVALAAIFNATRVLK